MASRRRNHAEFENGTEAPAEPAGQSAAERFAELEEKLFGDRSARVDGKIERGHGSLFRALTPEDRARYLALEKEVAAEAAVAAARASLAALEKVLAEAEAHASSLKNEG